MAQSVLVFEAALLDRIGRFQGYSLDVDTYLPVLLDPGNNHFMERDTAEQDVRYKQLIPYVVLRWGETVFRYVRGQRSSESRLRAMRSIGLGGHIEPADRSLFSSDSRLQAISNWLPCFRRSRTSIAPTTSRGSSTPGPPIR